MYFNSFDKNCKSPIGAVECGSTVRFCVYADGFFDAFLLLRAAEGGYQRLPMERGEGCFTAQYRFEGRGVFFYHFALCGERGEATLWRDGPMTDFQQTVYEQFDAPEIEGIIYQIFPDRFYRAEIDERVHFDERVYPEWGAPVLYALGESGAVINNDYFGGNLRGIIEKLPYLRSLSVGAIYLNPIFEAHSNHRYNTADYLQVDPLLGSNEDFAQLCEAAHAVGIKIILDGVFSHTGSDSVYFNKNGRYDSLGAYQSQQSPYYSWYSFEQFPERYASWWGFKTLPEVNELDEGFCSFITGEGGVIDYWMGLGADGFRLDVADELPDEFIERIRTAVRRRNPQGVLYGEVWEDASNKVSYGAQRAFLYGRELDSVMNYPFRELILDFVKNRSGTALINGVRSIIEHYPPASVRLLMNSISTHDTVRALTALAGEPERGRGRDWQAAQRLSESERARGLQLLRLASLLQYTLPGTPCLYYADELGCEGYRDPFNRRCFDWSAAQREGELLQWFRALGRLRQECPALAQGDFLPAQYENDYVSYLRVCDSGELYVIVNPSERAAEIWLLPGWASERVLLGGEPKDGILTVPPGECALLGRGEWARGFAASGQ